MRITACILFVALSSPAVAWAQAKEDAPALGVVEVTGAWGAQLGDTSYLPDGSTTQNKYPFVSGWGAGATAGVFVLPKAAVTLGYRYWTASSVQGSVDNAMDRVQGYISYHTMMLGMRIYHDAGPGRLRAEMGAGIALPFEARTEYDYSPQLAALGITGTGTRTDQYGIGIGAMGGLAYEYLIPRGYVSLGLEMRTLQADNNGEKTIYTNMADMTANPPTAGSSTIEYGNGKAQPTTYSIQDVGVRLAVGARF